MTDEREVYRGFLPGESTAGDIPVLGPVISALAPIERDVITPPKTTYTEDMGLRYATNTPGEYGEPRLGTPAVVQGGIDFFRQFIDDPKAMASAIGEGIASIPEQQMLGAQAMMRGADYTYDPETGEEYTYDPLLLPAATAVGTATSIARVADDGSTVLGIMGGRMSKDGPSKFSEARALRSAGKSKQEIFDEIGAYFDDDIFIGDINAFRVEIPTGDSRLKGVPEKIEESTSSKKGGLFKRDVEGQYLYQDKENAVFGLRPDVAIMRQTEDGYFVDSKIQNPEYEAFVQSKVKGEKVPGSRPSILKDRPVPTLSEILDFPKLYEQYPQLRDIPVIRLDGSGALYAHVGLNNRPTIAVGYSFNPKTFQSSLLHEVQHAVQHIESFPQGASGKSIMEALDDELGGNVDKDFLKSVAFPAYESVYGEVEARLVQRRFENPEEAKIDPVTIRRKEAPDNDLNITEQEAVEAAADMVREGLEYGDYSIKEVYPDAFKKEGGVITLADVARNTGRGPRGVASLALVARNMNRPMVS